MGMFAVFIITFQLFLFCGMVNSKVPCGPQNACTCDKPEMDCSNTQKSLQEICSFVTRMDLYNNSVTRLLADNNGYTNVSVRSTEGCVKLRELSLAQNNFDSIQSVNLTTLERLQNLNLNQNNFSIYEEGNDTIFLVTKYLRTLRISGNKRSRNIQKMRYPNLSFFEVLKEISIDGLPVISVSMFDETNSLEVLNINGFTGHCFLNQISKTMFPKLTNVKVLNISNCNISVVKFGSFMELPSLQSLDISYNILLTLRSLENISYGLQFTDIRSLNMSKVQSTFGIGISIRKRDLCYLWNTSLHEFVASSNRIQVIENNALILVPRTLEIVRVNDNILIYGPYVTQIPCLENMVEFNMDFQHRAHMYSIYQKEPHSDYFNNCENEPPSSCPFLSDDFLRNISANIKKCTFYENNFTSATFKGFSKNLRKLTHTYSSFNFPINAMFVEPPDNLIEYIDMSGNVFPIWRGPVGPLMNLKFLNLSNTYCTCILPSMFEGQVKRLENLQLQHNLLGLSFNVNGDQPSVFRSLYELKVLNLSMNYINTLPSDIFSNLGNLETIDLGYNNKQECTFSYHGMTNLTNLFLHNNFIDRLPHGLVKHLETVSKRRGIQFTIDMRNNTFVVSCQNQFFLEWMVKHEVNMIGYNEYLFEDSDRRPISQREFKSLVRNMVRNCASYTVLIVLTSTCLAVCIAICVCGLVYRNRRNIRYFIYMTKRRFWKDQTMKDSLLHEDFKFDVFISYDEEDRAFAIEELVPYLERMELKLCLHHRDFKFGRPIGDSIIEAIKNSRYTVCILSSSFLESRWCRYEFHMARMENMYSRKDHNSLLVIKYGDVVMTNMTPEMIKWLQENNYLEYSQEMQGNALFWTKLRDEFVTRHLFSSKV